ncbi:hypothetical protein BKA70DRAFT_1129813 [Coprinopsis sp. MPI-PUGE-AT-0042]|nr:hypothetical protein BKA70DRAFT_1129813 [Coprinopsis sp. MPI-PUGE-AT-0042]
MSVIGQVTETSTLSVTDVVRYHHLQCDLFLRRIARSSFSKNPNRKCIAAEPGGHVARPSIARGNEWERRLMSWLSDNDYLLTIPSTPATSTSLSENILADERDHFFVAGVMLNPSNDMLVPRFSEYGEDPVGFRTMKLDLVEITREKGRIVWTVIDAKASELVKSTHQIQTYLYHICLGHFLQGPLFVPSGRVGVWLPPRNPSRAYPLASFSDIKKTSISSLAPSLDNFIFKILPRNLALAGEDVEWHLNPLCSDCEFENHCKADTVEKNRIGAIANLSRGEGRSLRRLIDGAVDVIPGFKNIRSTDIEDLHVLVTKAECRTLLKTHMPMAFEDATAVLRINTEDCTHGTELKSLVLESVRRNTSMVIPQLSLTCPPSEDFTVIMSVLRDVSSTNELVKACYFNVYNNLISGDDPWFSLQGIGDDILSNMVLVLHRIKAYRSSPSSLQFYVWSAAEAEAFQKYLRAVTDKRSGGAGSLRQGDLRQCIHTIAQGTEWACTPFSPPVLNHGLYHFLHRSAQSTGEMRGVLRRMESATQGSREELRDRIRRYFAQGERLEPLIAPSIVTVKIEAKRVLALPIPGRWDLAECYSALVSTPLRSVGLPLDTEIFESLEKGEMSSVETCLALRTEMIHAVLRSLRALVQESAKPVFIATPRQFPQRHLNLCQQPYLRNLLSIQEHEAACRMQDLWSQRANNSHAVIMEYMFPKGVGDDARDIFRLLSGDVEIGDGLHRHILVAENNASGDIPVEFIFDDLSLCGTHIPLSKEAGERWERFPSRVRDGIQIVDISEISAKGSHVGMRIWKRSRKPLRKGQRYRLLTRLVDFTTHKILACLFEYDLRWSDGRMSCSERPVERDHQDIPFLQLITDPASLGKNAMHQALRSLGEEIHSVYDRLLTSCGSPNINILSCKQSQYAAAQSVLSNRLTVVWGPPGLLGSSVEVALTDISNQGQEKPILFHYL